MKCHEARRLFFLYHDSELDPRSAEEVNLHLESCPACRDLWSRETRLEEAVPRAAWRSAGALDGFPWGEVEARVRAGRRPIRRARPWLGAAAVLLLAVAALAIFLRLGRAGPTVADAVRSAVEHHEKYLSGMSPVQVRGPDPEAVRTFYAGEVGFDVLVPDGRAIGEAAERPAELVGARRCTFLGGPVAYVSYRIGGRDATVILGPLKTPDPVMEAISRSAGGLILQELGQCRVLMATVRGVLFVAAGGMEPETLRRLLEAFQARRP
jgi:hypothetical protein